MRSVKKQLKRKSVSLVTVGLMLVSIFGFVVNVTSVSAAPLLSLNWQVNLGANSGTYIGPLAADLYPSRPGLEVVVVGGLEQGGTDGTVTVLDGTNGAVIWQKILGGVGRKSPFDVIDIDKDNIPEIIVYGLYPTVLRYDGSIFWSKPSVSSYNDWGAVADVDGDGYMEIFTCSGRGPTLGDDYFTKFSYDGTILAQNYGSWHPCWGGMSIGDANFDGVFELYQGDRRYGYRALPTPEEPYINGEWGINVLNVDTLERYWNDSDILCSSQIPMLADVIPEVPGLEIVIVSQSGSNAGLAVYNADGTVSTAGGKYRKDLTLGLAGHSQPTIGDFDGDGHLEILTCRSSYPKIWDLVDWKLDAILPVVSNEPPKAGYIDNDNVLDIILTDVWNGEIHIFESGSESTYNEIDTSKALAGIRSFTLVQDVDNDNLNELIITHSLGRVYCYNTPAQAPNPRPRSGYSFYSEYKNGVAEYVEPPSSSAPSVSPVSPLDGATNVPITLSQLSFTLTDFDQDKMSYTVTTTPNIGSGSGSNVGNGEYSVSISGLEYSTTYSWEVSVTDGEHLTEKTFTFTTQSSEPGWNDWLYQREITINPTQVSADQTDFPVLVSLTDAGLTSKAQADGDDFVFADSDQNKLDHQIEQYDSSTGKLVAWVKLPIVSATTETVFYMYYGNPSAANQQNPSAVWNSNYKLVLHLNEKTGTHYDSTTNNNNGTPMGGILQDVVGIIDGADDFDGSNDYVTVAHNTGLSGYTEAFTTSFWIRFDDTSRRQVILNKYNTAGNQRGWFIDYNPSAGLELFASQTGSSYVSWRTLFTPTAGQWYQITIVWESGAIPRFYVNGVQASTIGSSTLTSIYNNSGAPLDIGRSTYTTGRNVDGVLDEIQISNLARSSSSIQTSYNNQKNPNTFTQIGPEM